jgi:pyruvate-formate lyase-activating enzyme
MTERRFATTRSLCPQCRAVLPTRLVADGSGGFLEKTCPEHGAMRVRVARHGWYLEGLELTWRALYPPDFDPRASMSRYTSELTTRCDLRCPVCFADAEDAPREGEITLEAFTALLEPLRGRDVQIRLTGGEPTLRPDIVEIVRRISASGNTVDLATNGLKLCREPELLTELKRAGLRGVMIWIDSLRDPAITRRFRGVDLGAQRRELLALLEAHEMRPSIFLLLARGVSDPEVRGILELALQTPRLSPLVVRSYRYLGRCGLAREHELLQDEVVQLVAEHSGGRFTLQDGFQLQRLLYALSALQGRPQCYLTHKLWLPRDDRGTLAEVFQLDRIVPALEAFEARWRWDPEPARRALRAACLPLLEAQPDLPPFFHRALAERVLGPTAGDERSDSWLQLKLDSAPDVASYDIDRTAAQCFNRSLNRGPERAISRCQELIEGYGGEGSGAGPDR